MTPRSPYRPGAGIEPPFLAGRRKAIKRVLDSAGQVLDGEGVNPITLTGLRGMGKTVVLLHIADELRKQGWLVPTIGRFSPTKKIGAVWKDMRHDLVSKQPHQLIDRARSWEMGEVKWQAGGEVGTAGAKAHAGLSGTVRKRKDEKKDRQRMAIFDEIRDMAAKAQQHGTNVALLIDEAQDAELADLIAVASLGQDLPEKRWPLLIVLAGLQPLRDKILKAGTFAGRFPSPVMDRLEEAASREALTKPAQDLHVRWDEEALEEAVEWAAGVPYHVQVIGNEAWEYLDGARITLEAVRSAIPAATAVVEQAIFQPLWRRASEAEHAYLLAMARGHAGDNGVAVKGVVERLGKKHSESSMLRRRLVEKGLIHGLRYGLVDFSYPGFADYVRRLAVTA